MYFKHLYNVYGRLSEMKTLLLLYLSIAVCVLFLSVNISYYFFYRIAHVQYTSHKSHTTHELPVQQIDQQYHVPFK